jgi:hypothetical protein
MKFSVENFSILAAERPILRSPALLAILLCMPVQKRLSDNLYFGSRRL